MMTEAVNQNVVIQRYILEYCVPMKMPKRSIQINFDASKNVKQLPPPTPGVIHEQQKCTDLVLPFARAGAAEVAEVSDVITLVEPDLDMRIKRVLQVSLETTPPSTTDWQPGDTIGVLPTNAAHDVQWMLDVLQLNDKADVPCQLDVIDSTCCTKLPAHIPKVSTPRLLLADCLNLRSVPKKQFLRALAEFCSADDERKFLYCLSSREGTQFYKELILVQGFTLRDILQLCPTCQPPFALLIEHLQRLLPRPYSISSSPLADRNQLKIICSVLPQRPGVTTGMMDMLAKRLHANMEEPPRIVIYHRETNKFRFTEADLSKNQILIGIGTGVAPFIGFLEHKELSAAVQKQPTSKPTGTTWLIAGAKTPTSMLHRKRLLEWRRLDVLNCYHESFSRSPDAPHHYVQELLDAHASKFVEMLMHTDTTLYVCADGAQRRTIETGIATCMSRELKLSPAEVADMIKEQRKVGKFCEDVWV